MKNQQVKLERRNQPLKLIAVLVMLLTVCCFCGVLVAAANTANAPIPDFTAASEIVYEEATGTWVKIYDGKDTVENVKVRVGNDVYDATATFDSADAGDPQTLTLVYNGGKTLRIPARIDPIEFKLEGEASTTVSYDPANPMYENVEIDATGVTLEQSAIDAGFSIGAIGTVSFNTAETAGGVLTAYAQVTLIAPDGVNASNYKVALLPVTVNVKALELVGTVEWSKADGAYEFTYGAVSNGIPACLDITANFKSGDVTVPMAVMVSVGEELYTLAQAYELGLYGNIYKKPGTDNTVEGYTLVACSPNADLYILKTENEADAQATVQIKQAVYTVSFGDKTYLGEADLVNPANNVKPQLYQLLVTGEGVPADILAKIKYTYYDANDNILPQDGAYDPGIYKVVATLPELAEGGYVNYRFSAKELSATLTVKRNYLVVGNKQDNALLIVVGEDGIPATTKVTFSVPETLDRKAVRGFKEYKGYSIAVSSSKKSDTFTLMIPVASELISNPRCAELTKDDIYLYDGLGNMIAASEKYSVKLSDDGAYYIIENFSAADDVTFVIAPAYDAPFWTSPLGIALIIVLILLILLIMLLIGLRLRKIERSKKADEVVIDTEGDVPASAPAEAEEKIENVDEHLDEGIDTLATELRENVSAEEEAVEEVDATAIVEDTMDEMLAEAAAEELDSDEVTDAMVEEIVEDLAETAVATEAMAIVTEEDDDNDNDSDDDDDDNDGAFGGFTAGLTYIDTAAEPEIYADMLAREARGEIQIVYRYRRSYQSRLAQSQGSVQDYYNIVKNELLSYKGIKSRISWNYEAFNLGRTHVAKFNAKTRTLYLYMALDPAELTDSKYGFADMSSKKKYASVPVLMKVKGDRKFKHALELITLLCEEKLGLAKKKVVEEVDYKLPYMTTDALVAEGLVKKLAAEIPMELLVPVADDAEVTAVEPTPVAEAPTEEVPASAEAATDETTNA